MQVHFTNIVVYFQSYWYINKVYRLILKHSNLLMMHTMRKTMSVGVTNLVLGGVRWLLKMLAIFVSQHWPRVTLQLTFHFWKKTIYLWREYAPLVQVWLFLLVFSHSYILSQFSHWPMVVMLRNSFMGLLMCTFT